MHAVSVMKTRNPQGWHCLNNLTVSSAEHVRRNIAEKYAKYSSRPVYLICVQSVAIALKYNTCLLIP